jgi:hypothetical protein
MALIDIQIVAASLNDGRGLFRRTRRDQLDPDRLSDRRAIMIPFAAFLAQALPTWILFAPSAACSRCRAPRAAWPGTSSR